MQLVACGNSQIPGIDFSGNYSLVVNHITFCILLLMVMHFGYLAKIVDVENTILYGDVEEEIIWSILKTCQTWEKMTASFHISASLALYKQCGRTRRKLTRS